MIPIYDDNPAIGKPILTILIIASCVLVWLWQIGLGSDQQKAIIYYGLILSASRIPPSPLHASRLCSDLAL